MFKAGSEIEKHSLAGKCNDVVYGDKESSLSLGARCAEKIWGKYKIESQVCVLKIER